MELDLRDYEISEVEINEQHSEIKITTADNENIYIRISKEIFRIIKEGFQEIE